MFLPFFPVLDCLQDPATVDLPGKRQHIPDFTMGNDLPEDNLRFDVGMLVV